jgi:uncharacterized protein (TIGR02594 family)
MFSTLQLLKSPQIRESLSDCPWMDFAIRELGQVEIYGDERHNGRILQYHSSAGVSNVGDETPWCSSFANWCMTQAGVRGSGKPNARSWLRWGVHLSTTTPVFGCIAVFNRGNSGWQGHVGFLVGETADEIFLLGGNQSGALSKAGEVCVKTYPKSRLLGLRWPLHRATPGRLRRIVAGEV